MCPLVPGTARVPACHASRRRQCPNGTYIKVLEKVIYPDTSWTKFLYNGYGQVKKIENYAEDNHLLNYTRTNLDSVAADQTDVPRFTEVTSWAENFNSGNPVTTNVTRSTGQSYTSPAGGSAMTATKIEVTMTGHPHNAVSKSWYGESRSVSLPSFRRTSAGRPSIRRSVYVELRLYTGWNFGKNAPRDRLQKCGARCAVCVVTFPEVFAFFAFFALFAKARFENVARATSISLES